MRSNKLLWIAVGIIIILSLTLLFFLVLKPQYNKFVLNKQVEGYNIALGQIVNVVNEQGGATIPNGDNYMIVCQNVEVDNASNI